MTEFQKFLKTFDNSGGIAEAARRLDCSRAHIYNILNGKTEMSRQMAETIENISGGQFKRAKLLWG